MLGLVEFGFVSSSLVLVLFEFQSVLYVHMWEGTYQKKGYDDLLSYYANKEYAKSGR